MTNETPPKKYDKMIVSIVMENKPFPPLYIIANGIRYDYTRESKMYERPTPAEPGE